MLNYCAQPAKCAVFDAMMEAVTVSSVVLSDSKSPFFVLNASVASNFFNLTLFAVFMLTLFNTTFASWELKELKGVRGS